MITQQARDVHFSSIVVDAHSDDIGWVVDLGEELAEDTDGDLFLDPLFGG